MSEEKLYTVPEVAGLLRESLPTVYRLVKRGELPAFRVARLKLMFRAADVAAYIEAGRVEPAVKVTPPSPGDNKKER